MQVAITVCLLDRNLSKSEENEVTITHMSIYSETRVRAVPNALREHVDINKPLLLWVAMLLIGGWTLRAQCPSPTALTNGVTGVAGTTWWAFQTEDGGAGDAQVGFFSATVTPANAFNPFPIGAITGTMTFNNAGVVVARAPFSGRWTIDSPDCRRGTISFMLNGNAYQYTFIFTDTPSTTAFGPVVGLSPSAKLLMVSSNTQVPNTSFGPASANRGIAYLLPGIPSCANPADPLAQINGTNWSFIGESSILGEIGNFQAAELPAGPANPIPKGTLNATSVTTCVTLPGTPPGFLMCPGSEPGAVTFGTYAIYGAESNFPPPPTGPSCAGGQLFLSGNGTALQFDFVFAPDDNGRLRRMLGVNSSPGFPGPGGTAGNFMKALQNP